VELSIRVPPAFWERTVVVEEVLYTVGVVVLMCFSYGLFVPRPFGGFVQVLQTVQVAVLGRPPTRPFVISIILTLNKIFEYVEMTIFSSPIGSPKIPRRFDFFA
jgi:hypothetical protein